MPQSDHGLRGIVREDGFRDEIQSQLRDKIVERAVNKGKNPKL